MTIKRALHKQIKESLVCQKMIPVKIRSLFEVELVNNGSLVRFAKLLLVSSLYSLIVKVLRQQCQFCLQTGFVGLRPAHLTRPYIKLLTHH